MVPLVLCKCSTFGNWMRKSDDFLKNSVTLVFKFINMSVANTNKMSWMTRCHEWHDVMNDTTVSWHVIKCHETSRNVMKRHEALFFKMVLRWRWWWWWWLTKLILWPRIYDFVVKNESYQNETPFFNELITSCFKFLACG